MPAQVAVNVLWGVWYVTWILAVVWSGKTKTQMRRDMAGLHRVIAGVGAFLLFVPALTGPAPAAFPGPFIRRLWAPSPALDWSLFGLTVLSFAFCWWARLHLGRLWSGFVTLKEDHRIIDTGPYGLVRHPIYAGVIFAAATTALIRATPAALLGAVLLAVGFRMTARIEERFLREQLGAEAYDGYSRRVGMLIPRLG
jgi:protein-S-isoprenylcysteine O-methyltransferase Ste14